MHCWVAKQNKACRLTGTVAGLQAVLANQGECEEFAQAFSAYSDLWTHDMATTLSTWLSAHTVTDPGTLPAFSA